MDFWKVLYGVPIQITWDSEIYNPEFLPYTEEGSKKSIEYGEVLNKEWKGHAALQTTAVLACNDMANWLVKTGRFKPEVQNDLKPEEVDFVIDFLMPYVKAGQFKAFWGEFGECCTLMSTREVWITPGWWPACIAIRNAGVPAYYAMLQHGHSFSYSVDFASKYTDKFEDVCRFMNFRLTEWWTDFIQKKMNYTTPSYVYKKVRPYMGPEHYDWAYMGKATYKPTEEWFKEMWPEKGEVPKRIADSLFLPEKYKWSKKEGKPHPEGKLREQGSVKDRIENTGFMLYWADYGDYYVEAWSKLRTYMPK